MLAPNGAAVGRQTGGATNVNATEVVERPPAWSPRRGRRPRRASGTTTASSVLLSTVTLVVVTVPNETVVLPVTKFLPVSTVSVPPVVRPDVRRGALDDGELAGRRARSRCG